jgi:hypothetical protein
MGWAPDRLHAIERPSTTPTTRPSVTGRYSSTHRVGLVMARVGSSGRVAGPSAIRSTAADKDRRCGGSGVVVTRRRGG